jgi:hypothetical protein
MRQAISGVLIAGLATLSLTASVSAGYWDRGGRHGDGWDRNSRNWFPRKGSPLHV